MSPPFSFDAMLIFFFLSTMLLLGILIRVKVCFVQRLFFPSCLIGGFLGLILVNSGAIPIRSSGIETFAYHLFNISFISIGLTLENNQGRSAHPKVQFLKGSLWMALVQGVTFPLQAIIGGLLVILFGLMGVTLFSTFGFLLPLAFNEGPGQALSFGKVWESVGFENGATIGLSFAAIGYFFAFFVGVPLVNWGIRHGYATFGEKTLPQNFLSGIMGKDDEKAAAGELTLHSSNVDTLAFQTAVVGLVYLLTYFFVKFTGGFLPPDAAKMLWGFCFFFGLGIAFLVRWVMERLGVGRLLDSGIQRRITGWSVDYLILSTLAAIQITVVVDYWLPIGIMSLISGLMTTLAVIYLGKQIGSYRLERTVAIYGTVTGTVSCGLLLLRVVDPEFKTPVAVEIAVMNILVLPIVGGCTLLVNAPIWWGWGVGVTILVYTLVLCTALVLIKVLKWWGGIPLETIHP